MSGAHFYGVEAVDPPPWPMQDASDLSDEELPPESAPIRVLPQQTKRCFLHEDADESSDEELLLQRTAPPTKNYPMQDAGDSSDEEVLHEELRASPWDSYRFAGDDTLPHEELRVSPWDSYRFAGDTLPHEDAGDPSDVELLPEEEAPPTIRAPLPPQPEAALRRSLGLKQAYASDLMQSGRCREAHHAFSEVLGLARRAGLKRAEGLALRCLAEVLDELGAPSADVEKSYQQAMVIAHRQDDMELTFNILTGMGLHAVKCDDLDMGEHFHLQALTLAKRVCSEREEVVAEGNLGNCLARSDSRRAESFEHLRRAAALGERLGGDPFERAMLCASLASALDSHGGHAQEAEREYLRTLELAHLAEEQRLEVDTLVELASLYEMQLEAPEKAQECRERLQLLEASFDEGQSDEREED